jgi:hypothetical protein
MKKNHMPKKATERRAVGRQRLGKRKQLGRNKRKPKSRSRKSPAIVLDPAIVKAIYRGVDKEMDKWERAVTPVIAAFIEAMERKHPRK